MSASFCVPFHCHDQIIFRAARYLAHANLKHCLGRVLNIKLASFGTKRRKCNCMCAATSRVENLGNVSLCFFRGFFIEAVACTIQLFMVVIKAATISFLCPSQFIICGQGKEPMLRMEFYMVLHLSRRQPCSQTLAYGVSRWQCQTHQLILKNYLIQ